MVSDHLAARRAETRRAGIRSNQHPGDWDSGRLRALLDAEGFDRRHTSADEAMVLTLMNEAAYLFAARSEDPSIVDPLLGFRDTEPIDWSNIGLIVRAQYPSLEDDLGLAPGFDPFARFL